MVWPINAILSNYEDSITFSSRMLSFSIIAIPVAVVSAVAIAIGILIFRVIFPTILSYPWAIPPETSRERKKDKLRTVVFAGSFNPPHWGHLVMIRYLAERYGKVICCIGVNPNKAYDVTPMKRAQILRGMLHGSDDEISCKNVRVEVVEGYIWRYAKKQNASIFFRGIRTWAADGAEERHLQTLNSWGPLLLGRIWPLKTIFLEGDPQYRDVSSTVVRRICAELKKSGDCELSKLIKDERLSSLIPKCVLETVVEAYGQ